MRYISRSFGRRIGRVAQRGAKKGQGWSRWTADTETAFLLALRLTGSAQGAAREIGRSLSGAKRRREREPAFAGRWQAALDEHARGAAADGRTRRLREGDVSPDGEGSLTDQRARYDGMTPLRQRAFLRALTATGSYAGASAAVGLNVEGVRLMRRRFPAFAAACERALAQAGATLEQIAFERATQGWEEPIVHAGKVVGTRRRYSDALLRMLVGQEAKRAAARDAARVAAEEAEAARPRRMSNEEVNALLTRKLDVLAAQNRRKERARQIEWADEMVRRGLAP